MNDPDQTIPMAFQPAAVLEGLHLAELMAAGLPHDRSPQGNRQHWEPPAPQELSGMISGYEITGLLGRGGMGAVYKGTQTSLDRPVAIKLLPPHLRANPEFEARFRREAKAMARLNHPNIVQIYDYGQTAAGQHYFVMEFVDGSDLSHLVRSGQLDPEGALNAVSQICSALQYAHELGFVHRDIKPANILLNQQGILKVGDFGLAKLVDPQGDEASINEEMSLTMSGMAMGTPHYAAPEQFYGHGHVDHRADLYSLGVMFYEMLTREIPRGAPKAPSRKIANLDVRIDGVVFKAMEHDPDERYQTAVELRTDVDYIRVTPSTSIEIDPSAGEEPVIEESGGEEPPQVPLQSPPTWTAPSWEPAGEPSQPFAEDIFSTTRSLNTTMLGLGTLAMLVIGALALFLANRKTGDTTTIDTTITNSETYNSYFTQLISIGLTTAKDLESVSDIRPYGKGFIGISREGLSWTKAQDLAQRTGAEILSVDVDGNGSRQQLLTWLTTTYATTPASSVWVREQGEARLLKDADAGPTTDLESPRKVFFQWGASPANPSSPLPKESPNTPPASAPPPSVAGTSTSAPSLSAASPGPTKAAEAPPATAPSPSPADRPLLSWTNKNGKVIQARFVQLSGETVIISMDGKQFTIPLSNLSRASVDLAKKLGGRAH